MTPERWALIEEVFHRAAESNPEQRAAVLDQACGDDSELREQVEALLSSDRAAHSRVSSAVRSGHERLAFPLTTGKTVSHYRILGGLDAGGMGVVYRAEDIRLNRRVAIKFLPSESSKDPAALGRFAREAHSAASLEHPNLCPIYEFGEHEGQPFLVMPLLKGQTLRELIALVKPGKAPFETDKLLDIGIQVADGLDAAHRQGIIHRDIKPANIFLTESGQVKLLDFGLAKVLHSDMEVVGPVAQCISSDLLLSRAGVVIGTAAYMAPEQIHGREADARSDLFSFGVVLYEMATGQRPCVDDSALAQQTGERHLQIPYSLEQIIKKAISKEPGDRYQTAAQIRDQLRGLRSPLSHSRLSRKEIAAGALLGALLSSAILWTTLNRTTQLPRSEFTQKQLTANSAENPVTGGEISPDGKYLLYSDLNGIYLKPLAGGESRSITLPEVSTPIKPNWQLGSWLPDSTRFFAIAERPRERSSLWNISIKGEGHRQLAEGAGPWGVSPDGSRLAITLKGAHELWVMGTNGEHPKKLYESGQDSHFRAVQWSPDGKRLAFIRINTRSGAQTALGDLQGTKPLVLLSGEALRDVTLLEDAFRDMIWLADGRLIYVGGEQSIHGMSCNLFEARIDTRTEKLLGKPRQMTNWAGFCVTTLSATSDGKRLAFDRSSESSVVYLADFDSERLQLRPPRRFTFTDDLSSPSGWTPDSAALFITSNREGSWGIYKQAISGGISNAIVTGLPDVSGTPVRPDGKWLLYGVRNKFDSRTRWIRSSSTGSPSEEIGTSADEVLCPHRTASCVAAERTANGKHIVFRALDPTNGVGQELARFDNEHADDFGFDLSSDGRTIVLFRQSGDRLQLLSLGSNFPLREIRVTGDTHISTISWAASGKGWFASNRTQEGADLLYIDLQGKARRLWRVAGYNVFLWHRPSPDGRRIAIQGRAGNSNMWMIENF